MRQARELTREELVAVVALTQQALYAARDGGHRWDPDRPWGPDTLDPIAEALAQAGLVPPLADPTPSTTPRPTQGVLMTNRELLSTPEDRLDEPDRERAFLLRLDGTPMPCPACGAAVNVLDAAGVDLDAYEFGAAPRGHRCPACAAALEQVVPLHPGGGPAWHWQLEDTWLREQLHKAREYDRLRQKDQTEPPA
jgi:hypothetical protein